MPMHPIVSVWGTATYNTAKLITKIFFKITVARLHPSLKNSTDFIQKFKHLSINPEEETLVSFGFSAVFTSIPVPVALQIINSRISTCTNFTYGGFRYVDDVYSATRKDQINNLQEHLNSIDPHIKFTIELSGTDELPPS